MLQCIQLNCDNYTYFVAVTNTLILLFLLILLTRRIVLVALMNRKKMSDLIVLRHWLCFELYVAENPYTHASLFCVHINNGIMSLYWKHSVTES